MSNILREFQIDPTLFDTPWYIIHTYNCIKVEPIGLTLSDQGTFTHIGAKGFLGTQP